VYTKIDELIWKDKTLKEISVEARLLFIYFLSCQHRNVLGVYYIPKFYIQADLGYPFERVSEGLGELLGKGFITYDEGSETVFVHNFLKYNPLQNANQVKGAINILSTIPKTPLFIDLLDAIKSFDFNGSEDLEEAINKYIKTNKIERVSKGLGKGLETVSKQEEVEEEVKEEVEEEEKTVKFSDENSGSDSNNKIPYQEIMDLYNNILGHRLSKTKTLSTSRKKKIKLRYKENLNSIEKWEELFNIALASPFLLGKNEKGWKATFYWFIENDNNYLKVLEGNYKSSKPFKKTNKNNNFHGFQSGADYSEEELNNKLGLVN